MREIKRKLLNGVIKTSDLNYKDINDLMDYVFYDKSKFNEEKKSLLIILYKNMPLNVLDNYSSSLIKLSNDFVFFDVILSNMNINKKNTKKK